MYKVRIDVNYLESVVNPDEEIIKETMEGMAFHSISSMKLGRSFHFKVEAATKEEAEEEVKQLAESLLVNPAMETYSFVIEEA